MFAAVNHLVADGGFCTKHVSISKHMRSLKHVRTYIIITYIIIYIYLSHIFHYIAYYSILYITYCHILSTWLEHTGTYDVLWPCLKCSAVHATTAQCSTKELREGEVPIEIFQFIASKTSPLRMIPDGYFLWLIWKSNQRKSFKWSFNTYIIYICIYICIYIYVYKYIFECFKLWPQSGKRLHNSSQERACNPWRATSAGPSVKAELLVGHSPMKKWP